MKTNWNEYDEYDEYHFFFSLRGNGIESYRKYIKLIRILFSEMLKINIKKKKLIFSVSVNVYKK